MGDLSCFDNIALIDRLRSHGRLTNEYAQEIGDRIEELEAQLDKVRGLVAECTPVIANARNTHSVRDGYEQGGYIKYVEMPRVTYTQMKKALQEDK